MSVYIEPRERHPEGIDLLSGGGFPRLYPSVVTSRQWLYIPIVQTRFIPDLMVNSRSGSRAYLHIFDWVAVRAYHLAVIDWVHGIEVGDVSIINPLVG